MSNNYNKAAGLINIKTVPIPKDAYIIGFVIFTVLVNIFISSSHFKVLELFWGS